MQMAAAQQENEALQVLRNVRDAVKYMNRFPDGLSVLLRPASPWCRGCSCAVPQHKKTEGKCPSKPFLLQYICRAFYEPKADIARMENQRKNAHQNVAEREPGNT